MSLSLVPEVHEPQEVPPDRPVPQDGQGQQRIHPAKRVHGRNYQHQSVFIYILK